MFFHASPTAGITILEPRVSNHGRPLVYFSDCRENVLVYLSNAVEKFCREKGIVPQGPVVKWGSYGFTPEGLLCLEEYWPGATEETYRGVSGYIYTVEDGEGLTPLADIPHAFTGESPVKVAGCEWIPDAYGALLEAQRAGKLVLRSYRENSEKKLRWIENGIRREFAESGEHPEYRRFLQAKFPFLRDGAEKPLV